MNDLNFFNPYIESTKFKSETLYYFFALVLVIIMLFYSFINQIKINSLLKQVNNLKDQVENEKIKTKVNRVKEEIKETDELEIKIESLRLLEESIKEIDVINTELLKAITLRIPDDVFLNSINMNSSSIEIKGIGTKEKAIAQFEYNLSKVEKFKNIFISNIYFEKDYYEFSLTISLKNEEVIEDED